MDMVGVRELTLRTSALLDQVQQTGQPVVITKHGRPIAVLWPVDMDAFYDFVLEHAPEFVASRKEVEDNLDV